MTESRSDMLAFTEDYIFHRLIFVNSGSSAYVEIPMARTGGLFGKNNEGKTSSLSAIKLFVLPEQNLKHCERKFGFASNTEVFTGIQSYGYYFPHPQSYIICEAENRKGRFCMLLKQSREELGYERYGIPRPYDDIKHLFWDFDSSANQGFGEPKHSQSPSDMVNAIKAMGAELIAGIQTIRDAIYARPGHLDDLSRYCLIPLNDRGEKGSAEALSAILGLSFDIRGSRTNSLPHAVATIIAGENSGRDTPLDFDVGQVLAEAAELKERTVYLSTLRNHRRQWSEVQAGYQAYLGARRRVIEQIPAILASKTLLLEAVAEKLQASATRRDNAHARAKQLKGTYGESKERHNRLVARRDALAADLTRAESRLTHIQEIEREGAEVGAEGEAAIIEWLESVIHDDESELRALKDQESGQQELQTLFTQRQALQREVESLESLVSGGRGRLLGHLSSQAQDRLYSLNPSVAHVKATPADADIDALEAFARLLTVAPGSGKLALLGDDIPDTPFQAYDGEAAYQRLVKRLDEKKAELKHADDQYVKLDKSMKDASSPQYRAEKIKQLESDLAKTAEDIKVIKAKDQTVSDAQIKKDELALVNEEVAQAEGVFNEAAEQYRAAMAEASQADAADEVLSKEKRAIEDAVRNVSISLNGQPDFKNLAGVGEDFTPLDIPALQSAAEDAQAALDAYPDAKESLITGFARLSQAGLLANQSDVGYRVLGYDDIATIYDALSAEFGNLEGFEGKLKADILHHNSTNATNSTRLWEIDRTITTFQEQVNEELQAYQISNLSEIQVHIDVDPRFSSLVKDLQDERFQGSELKNDAFYDRLSSFAEDFFVGKSRKIRLTQVITRIRYSFVKQGARTSTSQSNGTTCMLNIALLSILLKRLIPLNVGLSFPVVFDEIGAIDEVNLGTIKTMVESHGFVLFVANPYKTGVISSQISDCYDLSLHRLTEGKAVGQCTVIHYNMREGIERIEPTPATEAVE